MLGNKLEGQPLKFTSALIQAKLTSHCSTYNTCSSWRALRRLELLFFERYQPHVDPSQLEVISPWDRGKQILV